MDTNLIEKHMATSLSPIDQLRLAVLSGGDDPVDPLDLPDLDDLLTEIDSQLDGLIEERDFWKQRALSLGDNGSDFIERKTLEAHEGEE